MAAPISLSSHCLDTTRGVPAHRLRLSLHQHRASDNTWQCIHEGETDADGRHKGFPSDLPSGRYRVVFDTAAYFAAHNIDDYFSPEVTIDFLTRPGQHYHIPLLLSPFGYTTYRGS
eukprot:TRINITY_DN5280_c0_g1_i1.p1 TRINITY_DN5280_c0_g1~~TRINITY_DN5280_c0_g1_i1.p1  ORF type:complete len:130 (-),score=28.47 TRINITY_DN5280_c0_g1_i1:293-640(-)